MAENNYPSELIDLPSRGWFYPEGNTLSSGKLDLKLMTAKEEDILTSTNLLQKGIVLDKLVESLIVDKTIKPNDILLGDWNAILIAARILGYGKDYEVSINCPNCESRNDTVINLEEIKEKELDFNSLKKGNNEFEFILPLSGQKITFRLLNHGDEVAVVSELNMIKKIGVSAEVTTRIRKSIVAVEGSRDPKVIREFVERMPARDAAAYREHVNKVSPDVDLTFTFNCASCSHTQRMGVPIDVNFFWPNIKV